MALTLAAPVDAWPGNAYIDSSPSSSSTTIYADNIPRDIFTIRFPSTAGHKRLVYAKVNAEVPASSEDSRVFGNISLTCSNDAIGGFGNSQNILKTSTTSLVVTLVHEAARTGTTECKVRGLSTRDNAPENTGSSWRVRPGSSLTASYLVDDYSVTRLWDDATDKDSLRIDPGDSNTPFAANGYGIDLSSETPVVVQILSYVRLSTCIGANGVVDASSSGDLCRGAVQAGATVDAELKTYVRQRNNDNSGFCDSSPKLVSTTRTSIPPLVHHKTIRDASTVTLSRAWGCGSSIVFYGTVRHAGGSARMVVHAPGSANSVVTP